MKMLNRRFGPTLWKTLLGSTVAVGVAQGQVLLDLNFETDTPGQAPSESNVRVNSHGVAGNLAVVEGLSVRFPTNSLHFHREAGLGNSPSIWGDLDLQYGPYDSGIYRIDWEAAAHAPTTSSTYAGALGSVSQGSASAYTVNHFDGDIVYQDRTSQGGGAVSAGMPYTPNTPQQFTALVNMDNQTFDLMVNYQMVGTNREFQQPMDSLDALSFGIGGIQTEDLSIDNVRVERITPMPGTAQFTPLGDFDGGGYSSGANAVSADGNTVVGYGTHDDGRISAFAWRRGIGMWDIGRFPGGLLSEAKGVSGDGSVVVGYSEDASGPEAFEWSWDKGMTKLSLAGGNGTVAEAVSDSGTTIVGEVIAGGNREAVAWLPTATLKLGDIAGGRTDSSAKAISAEGISVIAGYGTNANDTWEAASWPPTPGTIDQHGTLPGGDRSWVNDISNDGSVMVGGSDSADSAGGLPEAFRYTNAGGMVGLGDLPGGAALQSIASGTSGDGSVVVGFGTSDLGTEAFVWDEHYGMRNLQNVLEGFGLASELAGWRLEWAKDVSDDGKVIAGRGFNPAGDTEAFVVNLPYHPGVHIAGLCSAVNSDAVMYDMNQDGNVDNLDVTLFLGTIGSLPGDADTNGQVEFSDFLTLSENFGSTPATWSEGDFDCNGEVGFTDFLLLAENFGLSGASSSTSAVPEPTGFVGFGLALAVLSLARRRRIFS